MTASLIDSALRYAEAGFPVVPLHSPDEGRCSCHRDDCKSIAKHPRTLNGLTDATTDPDKVRYWWGMWPAANIGLVVPDGYVVVDIDGQDGVDSLKAAGYEFPPTSIAKTGRGWHYVYRTNIRVPPSVGFLNHVDLRGPGSYIVAAPSRHANGTVYEWRRPLEVAAETPAWLTERGPLAEGFARERFDTAGTLEGVSEGNRDSALFRLSAKLRYADVPYEIAETLVLEAASKCVPPFPERDALAKVQGAYARYQPTVVTTPDGYTVTALDNDAVTVQVAGPKGLVEIDFTEMELGNHSLECDIRVTLNVAGSNPQPYIQRLNVLSMSSRESMRRELDSILGKDGNWASILSNAITKARDAFVSIDRSVLAADIAAPERMEFIIENMIPDDGTTILFGAGSGGKTYVALHMAICVAMGLPWMGRPTQKRNVLWIDHETGAGTFGYRMGRVCRGLGIERQDVTGLFYWHGDGMALADSLPGLKRTIAGRNIGLLALDHIALACGGEPEQSDSALRFYRAMDRLHVPMLAIAHVTGDGERDPALVKRPFGTVFWSNGARRTWFIQREQEQESSIAALGLFCRKVNDGTKPSDFGVNVFFEEDGGPVHLLAADMRLTPVLQATRGREWEIHGVLDGPMTVAEIAERIGAKANSVHKTMERHPRLFSRADPSEVTRRRGAPSNVVHWVRFSEASETERPLDSRLDNLGQPVQGATVQQSMIDRCPACTAPLFGDQCAACLGWN